MQDEVFVPQRMLGLLGYPVGHSLGPLLHNWALQENSLPWVYMSWSVPGQNLSSFLAAVRVLPIYGLSVTIPHKRAVMSALDFCSRAAQKTGAVNTLYWSGEEICGDNTDCAGFAAPLLDLAPELSSALILGSGGAAQACIVALQDLGLEQILVSSRNQARLQELQNTFDIQVVHWAETDQAPAQLLVNTTPVGMSGPNQEGTPFPGHILQAFTWVYDLVYNPLETRLLQEAREAGCKTISGLEMFLHQAQAQFRLWSGSEFDVQQARQLLNNAMLRSTSGGLASSKG
ncbi:MAG: shikimate dehydrogenase [Desulfohalobiaceae bacterium]